MSESSDDCPKPLLTDFGLSHVLSPAAMTVQLITDDVNAKGTLPFMAKEMLSEDACREDFYTEASDVWAFGMTIYVRGKSFFTIRSSSLIPYLGDRRWKDAFPREEGGLSGLIRDCARETTNLAYRRC